MNDMTQRAQQIATIADMLPEEDQKLVFEMLKRMMLAWDPDYTKLTPAERKVLEQADIEFKKGETVSHEDIDWN